MAGKYVLANSANLYAQNGSTEFKVITSTGDVIAGAILYGNSSDNMAIDSSGNMLLGSLSNLYAYTTDSTGVAVNSSGEILYRGYDMRAVQTISSAAASTATAITGYGITIYEGDTGCSLPMSAPVYIGVRKTLIFTQGSSIARSINSSQTTGSTDNDRTFSFFSTAATNSSAITFTTGSTVSFTFEMIGVSTSLWLAMPDYSSTPLYTLATT